MPKVIEVHRYLTGWAYWTDCPHCVRWCRTAYEVHVGDVVFCSECDGRME